MSDNAQVHILRGQIHWAKILGDPVPNYNKDGKEWTFDFVPNDQKEAEAIFEDAGVGDRIRTKKNKNTKEWLYDKQLFVSFKQKELRADGNANDPIRVVDAAGVPWKQDVKIGNGSLVDVKFVIVDNGPNRYMGVYPRAVRVLEHVPYEAGDFDTIDENDEFYEAAKRAEERAMAVDTMKETFTSNNLDDDIPV